MITDFFKKIINLKSKIIPQNQNNLDFYGEDFLCNRIFNLKQTEWADVYIPINSKIIGVYLSGGIKSTILTFILAKIIKENNLSTKILPLTWKRNKTEYNTSVATNIIQKIKDILQINDIFLPHTYLKFSILDDNFIREWEIRQSELDYIKYVYSCVKYENTEIENHVYVTRPFNFIDNEYIIELYIKYGLVESLLPYTRSCDGDIEQTMFFKESCKKCDKCIDRKNIFDRFKNMDPYEYICPPKEMIKNCESL